MPRKPRNAEGGDWMNHPKMNDAIRAEIVTRLAMYDSQQDIQTDLAERGIQISRQAISHYVPGNNRNLAKKWVDLFHVTRENWLLEMAAEPIANRTFRLRRLQEIHTRAMKRGDLGRAQSVLEQAAKEVGNVFTNVAKVQGTLATLTPADMTAAEKRNMLQDRLIEAMANMPKKAPQDATLQ